MGFIIPSKDLAMIMEEFGSSAVENLKISTGWKMMSFASFRFFFGMFSWGKLWSFQGGSQKKKKLQLSQSA